MERKKITLKLEKVKHFFQLNMKGRAQTYEVQSNIDVDVSLLLSFIKIVYFPFKTGGDWYSNPFDM